MNVMDTFYDGDLKDIWDSDLDPTETLKLANDTDLPNWFLDRDENHSAVILNDRLISDALLNGTFPIKSEHSYSLSNDGESNSSPRSFSKMEDLEYECYPAVSLKTVNSNMPVTIDPKSLTLNYSTPSVSSISESSIYKRKLTHPTTLSSESNAVNMKIVDKVQVSLMTKKDLDLTSTKYHTIFGENSPCRFKTILLKQEKSKNGGNSSDIEIDDSRVKSEPLSPNTSCPSSPSPSNNHRPQSYPLSLKLTNVSKLSNTELIFEHENGCLQINASARKLISPEIALENIISRNCNAMVPKIITDNPVTKPNSEVPFNKYSTSNAFNIPLTPPSSLSSEDSQGDTVLEHISAVPSNSTTIAASKANGFVGTETDYMDSFESISTVSNVSPQIPCFNRSISGNCTRQPIHTPLISSQPKGSTGDLLLTEEEKRTLLAEGYPIPQKLPLTKAEEKSLKKIRRKIKNKISAQESRRKKKEYMDQLERRVETLANENVNYKCRVKTLEDAYASVLSQLKKLEAIVDKQVGKKV